MQCLLSMVSELCLGEAPLCLTAGPHRRSLPGNTKLSVWRIDVFQGLTTRRPSAWSTGRTS